MQCPKCHFENPDGMKFCGECGSKLEKICPLCTVHNPPQFKFCGECGRHLELPSGGSTKEFVFDEKLAKIQRYLPRGLIEKILSQRDKIEGERKQVTVMFCDMEGFTALSERQGPEEVYFLMDRVYEILIEKVHEYEGTINEMTGDGVMALFGAPVALEDGPQKAIRSAIAIQREIGAFNEGLRHERKNIPPVRMRVGIHTGPVVVGSLGNNLRVEFKAVGDTVNLASRVEALAEPGTILVTEKTFEEAEGYFRFEALGEKTIKGKAKQVKIYRVIGTSSRRSRFDVSAGRGLTPFVGRERELELLLDGFERSKLGRGQAFSIVSEAGLGKSRLLYEFRKAIANENVTFLEGRCLSYHRGAAYHVIIDIMKSNFNIREGDTESKIEERLKKGLKGLGVDVPSTLPYLLELLSVKDSGVDGTPMSREARKDRIIEALKCITIKSSGIRPLIMAFEDLQSVDKSSEDTLKSLLENIGGSRVFLIFTYRPGFFPSWGGKSYYGQINLNRLSIRESLMMVRHLLGNIELGDDVLELILEKTEGVPFFIEEFVRTLKDMRVIEEKNDRIHLTSDIHKVSIPATIQEVIMARVDALPEKAKQVLQAGSAIEREFNYALVKRVSGLPEDELLSHLSVLKDSEHLYERGIYPQSSFVFKHALTQEVVYESILTSRKTRLHEEIGTAIEELYKDSIEECYGVLAEHFILSGNHWKGAEYSRLACQRAAKSASFADLIAHAKKRVTCLEALPETIDVVNERIDARTALALYLFLMNYVSEAKEAIDPIWKVASLSSNKSRLSQMYTIMGSYDYMVEEDFSMAFKHLEEALKISEEAKDIASSVIANYFLGMALAWNCEFEKTLDHVAKALNVVSAVHMPWIVSLMKSNLSLYAYNYQGRISLGYPTSREALKIAEESGDSYSRAMAYTCHGISCFYRGFLREAEKNLFKGVEFSERIKLYSFSALAHQWLATTYFHTGEYQKSGEHFSRAIELRELTKLFPSSVHFNRVALARTETKSENKGIDLEPLYRCARENRLKLHDGSIARYIGEILLSRNDRELHEAENWIKRAINLHREYGMMWDLGVDHGVYAQLLRRSGSHREAEENRNKSKQLLKQCGAPRWIQKTDDLLS